MNKQRRASLFSRLESIIELAENAKNPANDMNVLIEYITDISNDLDAIKGMMNDQLGEKYF